MWPFGSAAPLGRRGEKLARRLLKRRGMRILATNYRCPAGEADLIALEPHPSAGAETVAFVEVKTRSSDAHADPSSAVDADKRRRMRKVAEYYLRHHPAEGCDVRFDVVSVVLRGGGEPEIDYVPGAF